MGKPKKMSLKEYRRIRGRGNSWKLNSTQYTLEKRRNRLHSRSLYGRRAG